MWATFAIIAFSVIGFALEKWSIEATALATLAAFLLLFSLAPGDAAAFEACFGDDVALVRLGEVTSTPHMTIRAGGTTLTQLSIESMLEAWGA